MDRMLFSSPLWTLQETFTDSPSSGRKPTIRFTVEECRLSSRVAKSRVLRARAILQEGALKLACLLVLIFISILDEVLPRGAIYYIHFLLKTVIITVRKHRRQGSSSSGEHSSFLTTTSHPHPQIIFLIIDHIEPSGCAQDITTCYRVFKKRRQVLCPIGLLMLLESWLICFQGNM